MNKNIKKYFKTFNNCSPNKIGTKAYNLYRLYHCKKYNIVKALIIESSYYDLLIKSNNIKSVKDFNLRNFKIPKEHVPIILEEIRKSFGKQPLIIRSSANCEDLPIFSFAGQYDSFLNISEDKKIIKALTLTYLSVFREHAIKYAKKSKINLHKIKMSILIQPVIKIKIAGVMFTKNPVTHKNEVVIEYKKGLGDAIVSGKERPITKVVSSSNLEENEDFIKQLYKIGLKISKKYRKPLDIEWGYDGKRIFIFQVRPITTLKQEFKIQHNIDKLIKKAELFSECTVVNNGQVAGKVHCITNNYDKIIPNSIVLIKNKVNINYIHKLYNVKGVILTNGGILSHFAVILRELNVPCLICYNKYNFDKIDHKRVLVDGLNEKIFLIK